MNKIILVTICAALCVPLFTGCAASNLADVVSQAKGDPAKWNISFNGWGTSLQIERDGTSITNLPAPAAPPVVPTLSNAVLAVTPSK